MSNPLMEKMLGLLDYVAEYNARSANREAEVLFRDHVNKFEKEHGKITFN